MATEQPSLNAKGRASRGKSHTEDRPGIRQRGAA